ncbi:MAG TPA: hypothetical protein VFT62_08800 [Mycobacteriales bacterium]|nr:hypothetical protein [Mycobacteriales bacterium]
MVARASAGSPSAAAPGAPDASGTVQPPATSRRPLTIGMLYTSNGAANAALGVATAASSGPNTVMSALVRALNRRGGLAGRQLRVEYSAVDATSSDYSTQANAACSKFTQDKPVPVVLDFAFGNRYGMAQCLAKRGVADFGLGTSDTAGDNAVRMFASPDWMTSSRRYPAVLAGLHQTGYLTSSNKIGVLLENCPYLQRAYQRNVMPEVARLGLHVADTEGFDCTSGFSSAGPASASIQSAVLRFRSHGVDRVLIVSDYEQVALLLLANDAESQGWRPGYMLSSAAQAEVMRANIASGQWPQLHGIGWSPGLDTDDPHRPLAAPDRRCLDLIKSGGVSVSGWQNIYVATAVCSHVFFLDAALGRSNGDARAEALMSAIGSLGARFVAPGILDGRTFFGPTRRDGPAAVAAFGYVAACKCMRYTSAPFSAG